MSWQGWLSTGTALAVIFALALNLLAPDIALLAGLTLLLLTGVLSPEEAFSGFANPAVVSIAVLFVIASAIRETGGLHWITHRILGRPTSLIKAQLRMMLPIGILSAFLNNTPVVAMMVPTITDWAKRNQLPASKLLIPLSYAAILGGTCTLIGTSTNLVVAGMAKSHAPDFQIGMFELAKIGLPSLVVGFAYILIFSKWLLPSGEQKQKSLQNEQEYTVAMRVLEDSNVVGQTIEKAGLRNLPDLYLFEIHRRNEILPAVGPETRIEADDRLIFVGIVDSVLDVRKIRGLVPDTDQIRKLKGPHPDRRLWEVVIAAPSPLVGKTIRETEFRTRYNAAIIAVRRQGERIRSKIGDITLKAGDVLLIETQPSFFRQNRYDKNFALISQVEGSAPVQHEKAKIAGLLLLLLVLTVSFGWLDLLTTALAVAGLMILTGCLSAEQARGALEIRLIITIAASFGIGMALDNSGAAQVFAHTMTEFAAPYGITALLAVIFFSTSLLSAMITNTASAALMFPIAASAAETAGVELLPFACILMLGASASFSTPIGYQTNLMVYGPGRYRFSDFIKFGLPLQIIVGIVAIAAANFFWITFN